MSIEENKNIVKRESAMLRRVGNQIAVTNKLVRAINLKLAKEYYDEGCKLRYKFQEYQEYKNPNTYNNAVYYFSKAIELNPNYANAYLFRGEFKSYLKDYMGALEDYNKAASIDPHNADVYWKRHIVKEILNDYQGAIADCTEIIKIKYDPAYIPSESEIFMYKTYRRGRGAYAYRQRGKLKEEYLKDYSGALTDYTNAIEIDPSYDFAYLNRVTLRLLLKDYKGAIEDCTKIIDIQKNYVHTSYYYRGQAKNAIGNIKGACEDWKKAIEHEKKYPNLLAGGAKTKEAEEMIKAYCKD
jgi:tetratricopeptide (TPR) repeat protein